MVRPEIVDFPVNDLLEILKTEFAWKMPGLKHSLGSRIVTYVDDLVTLCGKGKAEEALSRMRKLMGKLKLTVNVTKRRREWSCRFSPCPSGN